MCYQFKVQWFYRDVSIRLETPFRLCSHVDYEPLVSGVDSDLSKAPLTIDTIYRRPKIDV